MASKSSATNRTKEIFITLGLGTLVYLALFIIVRYLTFVSGEISALNRIFGVLQIAVFGFWVWHIVASIIGSNKNAVHLIRSWKPAIKYTAIGLLTFVALFAIVSFPTTPENEIPVSTQDVSVPESPADEYSFKDDFLKVEGLTIKITDTKVIAVGESGNEYGDKPVIAFWYDITNLSDVNITPLDFIGYFKAYQDNDPNIVNELNVSSTPDSSLLDVQNKSIKKGGTVSMAVGYELDDLTTPVQLIASDGMGGVAGIKTVNLR